jgi:cysteine-rich repeat protein
LPPTPTSTPTTPPVEVCPATQDPCLIDRAVELHGESTIDVRPRGLRVTANGEVRYESLIVRAGALAVDPGAILVGMETEDGSADLTLEVESAVIAGSITARGDTGGDVTVRASGAISVTGTIDLRDTGESLGGGSVELDGDEVTMAGTIRAGGGSGGYFIAVALRTIAVSGTIDAPGADIGGEILLTGFGGVTLARTSVLSVDASAAESQRGHVQIDSGDLNDVIAVPLALEGVISMRAALTAGIPGLEIYSNGPLTSGGACRIDGRGGTDGEASDIDLFVFAGDLDLDCSIDLSAPGEFGTGGGIYASTYVDGSLAVRGDIRANGGWGGSHTFESQVSLVVNPGTTIEAKGNAGVGGSIELLVRSSPYDVLTPRGMQLGGVLDASGGGVSAFPFYGSEIAIESIGDLVIGGTVRADGGTNELGRFGGEIDISVSNGGLRLDAPLSARGRIAGGPGGQVRIAADEEILVGAGIDASAANGPGGTIGVRSLGSVTLGAALLADGGSGGTGGRIELLSRDDLTIHGALRADGGGAAQAGSIAAEACDLQVSSTGSLSSRGTGGLNRLFGRTIALIDGDMLADPATGRNELVRGAGSAMPSQSGTTFIEPQAVTRYELSVKSCAVCGDRRIESPETCDDGNTVGGDGCSAACLRESTRTPTPSRTRTHTAVASPTATQTTAAAPTATATPAASGTAGSTATRRPTPTSTPTRTSLVSPTRTPSATPTTIPGVSATPTRPPTSLASVSPSATPTATPARAFDHNRDGCVTAADLTALLRRAAADGASAELMTGTIEAIFAGCE